MVIALNAAEGVLDVYQDIVVYAGLFDSDEQATLEVADDRYVYIYLARGGLTINGVYLMEGDGLREHQETQLHFSQGEQAEVLAFNMRAHELPEMARYTL